VLVLLFVIFLYWLCVLGALTYLLLPYRSASLLYLLLAVWFLPYFWRVGGRELPLGLSSGGVMAGASLFVVLAPYLKIWFSRHVRPKHLRFHVSFAIALTAWNLFLGASAYPAIADNRSERASANRTEQLELLAEQNERVRVVDMLDQWTTEGGVGEAPMYAALRGAIRGGHVELVAELIRRGALADGAAGSALRHAIEADRPRVLGALLGLGRIDPETTSSGVDQIPLLLAVRQDRAECAFELLDAGADVMTADATGRNAAMLAADLGRARILERLLKEGGSAIVDSRDQDGLTPLMFACRSWTVEETGGKAPCVDLLIEHGADVRAVDERGRSAFFWALLPPTCSYHETILRALFLAGVDPHGPVGSHEDPSTMMSESFLRDASDHPEGLDHRAHLELRARLRDFLREAQK